MIFKVKPAAFLQGTVQLPGSKSYSIRAFLIALCGGRSLIINPSDCDDAKAALAVAKALGAKVRRVKNNTWAVDAVPHQNNPKKINVKESGTVLRFLLPLLALRRKAITIVGEGTLNGRPNASLLDALRQMGAVINGQGKKESVPIHLLKGPGLKSGRITIDGSLSSQFISALFITCPQLTGDTHLILNGKILVSLDYLDMTIAVLKRAKIKIEKLNARQYTIAGQQRFTGLKNFTVPSDYGLAAFLLVAASLIKSQVTLTGNLKDDLIQADGRILFLLKKMGVQFIKTAKFIKIKGPFEFKGGDFSLKNCPDLLPILTIVALFAKGKTRFYDIEHVRSKESDRISDLRNELLKIGAKIFEKKNEMTIIPQKDYKKNCFLDPHHDHRLAMAFSVLGLKLGAQVKDIECSHKSYPAFVKDFRSIIFG